MLEITLATIGFVTGIMGFITGCAALIWTIGAARSTHSIQYQPLPELPGPEPEPKGSSEDPFTEDYSAPKAERIAAEQKTRIITSFDEIFPDLDE